MCRSTRAIRVRSKAVNLLGEAKRPFVYVGGGAVLANASEEVRELVRLINAPCTNTLMGLGAYPGTDPQFVGMLGMHGTYEANMAMQYCDVLVAIGARFDDRVISVPSHFLAQPKKSFTSTSTRRRSPNA